MGVGWVGERKREGREKIKQNFDFCKNLMCLIVKYKNIIIINNK